MKIYNGDLFDSTNWGNESFLQINSCGIQLPSNKQITVSRKKGRIDYQLLYIIKGRCKVEYQGKTSVLHNGFVIYPPHIPQKYTDYENTKRIWIHFNGYNVADILKEAHLSGGIYPLSNSVIIEKMLLQLIVEHNQETTVSNEKGLLLYVLNTLGKLVNTSESSSDKIAEAITFITTHYNSEINIRDLSDSCNLSRSRFMYLFKEQTGMAPHTYQQMLRIKNSITLLTSTKLDIAEIGQQSGYQDPLYFSRIFKKCVGLSPKEYRAQFLITHNQ